MTGKEAAYPPQKEHYIGKPMAEFQAPLSKGTIIREYCNINGCGNTRRVIFGLINIIKINLLHQAKQTQ